MTKPRNNRTTPPRRRQKFGFIREGETHTQSSDTRKTAREKNPFRKEKIRKEKAKKARSKKKDQFFLFLNIFRKYSQFFFVLLKEGHFR